jgi:ABC-type transport system involved in cytochrome bd biosynthesis fused ATPase/permease subunit
VPQTAWIENKTFKENVLFEKAYDAEWYKTVIHACKLDEDLKRMASHDETEIEFGGANLSGGQKQRLGVARALYQDCDIYLFDDILSALDIYVGKWVFQKAIIDLLVNRGKTVVLVSQNLSYLTQADRAIEMKDGTCTSYMKDHPQF